MSQPYFKSVAKIKLYNNYYELFIHYIILADFHNPNVIIFFIFFGVHNIFTHILKHR